ncbi:zf-HC2 domain-containing protein, partial [Myxococcota bacterium]|nr:zf-HC2 domain-containing protein [Myxococcota bacterium]
MSHEHDVHVGEDLAALADGGEGLTPERRRALEAHVATCAACASALASAQLVLRTIDDVLTPPEPSQAFDARLFQALDEVDRRLAREARAPSLFERLAAVFTVPRLAAIAGAAAAVAVAVVLTRGPAHAPSAAGGGTIAEA